MDDSIYFNNFNDLTPDNKKIILASHLDWPRDTLLKVGMNPLLINHSLKINSDYLKRNLLDECDREIEVSYWQLLTLINKSTPIEEADYIIYGHFYARFHNFQEEVKKQIEKLDTMRKLGAKIIIVGKACNVKPYLKEGIKDILFFESHYAEKLGNYFHLPIKEQYFVYDEENQWLNIWPVDGCNRKCGFCRRCYMNIPFESLSLDYIKENLDWYQKNHPNKMRHIMLRAENLTEYGLDIYGYQALPKLIEILNSYPEIENISVMIGLAISEMNEEIIQAFCSTSKMYFMYINIETGSNRLLNLINKGHTREKAIEIYKRLKEAHPNLKMSTNVMLGLPTETIEDIIDLAELINIIEPSHIYVLRYKRDPNQPLSIYPYMSDELWAYHLKLFIRLLKQGKRKTPLLIEMNKVPKKKSRKYNREIIKLKEGNKYRYEEGECWQMLELPTTSMTRSRKK